MGRETGVPLRALIVEDSEDDALLLVRQLTIGGYAPEWRRVDTGAALGEALDEGGWDIIFGDFSMPQFSGMKALNVVRDRGVDAPFIFVSGTIGEDTAVTAMRTGAQDYIMKGNLKRLLPAVERELREARVRRERSAAEAARRAADKRFRAILTMAADAIISTDEDLRITVFNRGAEAIFGYREDEIIGQPLRLLIPERFRDSHDDDVAAFARSAEESRAMGSRSEVYGLHKDGGEFPAEASISRLVEDGKTAFTVILRDISIRKRTEDELDLLRTVTQSASDAGDVPSALAVTLDRICESDGWVLAQTWIPRGDGSAIECGTAWSCHGPGLEEFRAASLSYAFAPGDGLPGRVWASRQAEWVTDVTEDADFPRAPFARKTGLKAAYAIPVLANDGDVLAVLEFFKDGANEENERQTRLVSAVVAQLGSVLQRKRAEERLHYLAHFDALTGLPNRILFIDRLQQALADAHRRKNLVAVAFIDLDRFKTVNDSLGHGIGDLFLQAVAMRLKRCIREGDTVARLAGDEFTLILTDIRDTGDAARVAQQVLDSLAHPFRVSGHELYTSASLGMTLYPLDDRAVEGLVRNADIAMYRAKERGGNACEFYAAEMTTRARARLALENDLRRALERNEFLLHYQPVVDLRSGRISGMEALVRWHHPERGLVPPNEFIPVAEETGLIERLGEWVLREACSQYQAWNLDPASGLRIAVNVSPYQFDRGQLTPTVTGVLEETGVDPRSLELEITETLLMQNTNTILDVMHELGDIGVRFSVDDFGTGYSSLGYLKHLPIGRVKIDRSFVRDVPGDGNDVAIVKAILSMARSLALEVIAEGVETAEQEQFLRAHDCEYMQGYFFSRPVPSSDFARLLESQKAME